MGKKLLKQHRYFLKDSIRKRIDFSQTDQNRGIAAYDQEGLDSLLRIDGEEEFAVYLAPVGKLK